MTVLVNSLGDDYPTFPEFQRMLRDYERDWFGNTAKTIEDKPQIRFEWVTIAPGLIVPQQIHKK